MRDGQAHEVRAETLHLCKVQKASEEVEIIIESSTNSQIDITSCTRLIDTHTELERTASPHSGS